MSFPVKNKELVILEEIKHLCEYCDTKEVFSSIIKKLKILIPFSGYTATILIFRRTEKTLNLISLTGDDLATGNKIWEERYFKNKYYLIDPIILAYLSQAEKRRIDLQFWHDTYEKASTPEQKAFIEDAKKHGLHHGFTHGYRLSPVHGALFSFWSPEFTRKTNTKKNRWILDHCIVPLSLALTNTPNSKAVKLTDNQEDICQQMNMGLPVEAIAWLWGTSSVNISKTMDKVHQKYIKQNLYTTVEELPFEGKKRRGNGDDTKLIFSQLSRY